MKRAILIILDGCGIGEAPDAAEYGDTGANTLKNLAQAAGGLKLPTLQKWGLGNLADIPGVPPAKNPLAFNGKGIELSNGKDTISGHFEIAGNIVTEPFATFPHGFSSDLLRNFCEANTLPGILGNKTASGTQIIRELGEEHCTTNKPIVYTSADSVFQIACCEDTFGLERLYQICRSARIICDEQNIARVIARPFIREAGHFVRTTNRKDYAVNPPERTLMEYLQAENIPVIGFGKIPSIYNYRGFDQQIKTVNNDDGMTKLSQALAVRQPAFYFINLIDFDMLYGHRRDVNGFAKALEAFDNRLAELIEIVTEDDLLIITADHGNDPTFRGTDHTREMIPILAFQKNRGGNGFGAVNGFFHIAATIFKFLVNKDFKIGESFIEN